MDPSLQEGVRKVEQALRDERFSSLGNKVLRGAPGEVLAE